MRPDPLGPLPPCHYYLSATYRTSQRRIPIPRATPPVSLDALDIVALTTLTPLQLASLAARLAALQSSVASAMFQIAVAAPQTNAKDGNAAGLTRMIDADEACAILHKPRRWLFDHAKRYGWIKRLFMFFLETSSLELEDISPEIVVDVQAQPRL
jgi:hypothetical protein